MVIIIKRYGKKKLICMIRKNLMHSYNDHISKVAITCINKTIINL